MEFIGSHIQGEESGIDTNTYNEALDNLPPGAVIRVSVAELFGYHPF